MVVKESFLLTCNFGILAMQNCVLTELGVLWHNYGPLKTVSNLY